MTFEAIVFVLLGVCAMAGHATTQRYLLSRCGMEKSRQLAAQWLINALFLWGALWWWDPLTPITHSAQVFWIAVAISTIANIAIQYANAASRSLAENSLTAPIQALTPGLVTIAALTLGEFPSSVGIVGIALIMMGTYVHGRTEARTVSEWLRPFAILRLPSDIADRAAHEQERSRKNVRGLRWAYVSALCGTIGLMGDALIARNGDVALGFTVQAAVLFCVFAMTTVRTAPSQETMCVRTVALWNIVAGVLYGLHVLFIMSAFRLAPVAHIGSLKRLSIVLTALFAWWLLNETAAKKRMLPILIITAGAILLAFDPTIAKVVDRAHEALR